MRISADPFEIVAPAELTSARLSVPRAVQVPLPARTKEKGSCRRGLEATEAFGDACPEFSSKDAGILP